VTSRVRAIPAFRSAFLREERDELLMRGSWIAKKFMPRPPSSSLPAVHALQFSRTPDLLRSIRRVARPGVYLLNTYDLPSGRFTTDRLTLHEIGAGHAFQMSLATEHKNQPEFRQHTYISAYGRVALYCEQLDSKRNMYETPYDRFGNAGLPDLASGAARR